VEPQHVTPTGGAEPRSVPADTLTVSDLDFAATVETLVGWARDGSGGYVCTVNVDYVVRARRDPQFRELVRQARLRVPDGMGIVYGSRLAGTGLRASVTGRRLPEAVARHPDPPSIGLMGGSPGAGEKAAAFLRGVGSAQVTAVSAPLGFAIGGSEDHEAVRRLQADAPAILFVGLGSPKQDRWMARHAADLPGTVMVGIGVGIDVLGGMQPTPPEWMTRIGVEWAYRLVHEPGRLARRYLWDDPRFFWWMARARLRRS
jgi:N-acetylglucosaminyldiphosphoundecaprenol N-acetyl-beta-D-mannosaminyltransferase